MKPVAEHKVMRHCHSMWLHWVVSPVVMSSDFRIKEVRNSGPRRACNMKGFPFTIPLRCIPDWAHFISCTNRTIDEVALKKVLYGTVSVRWALSSAQCTQEMQLHLYISFRNEALRALRL